MGLNFNRFSGGWKILFGRFCKVFFSTRACHWAFAGTSVEVTFVTSGDGGRKTWGMRSMQYTFGGYHPKTGRDVFCCMFFCIVCYKLSMLHYVAAYANTWLPLGNCVTRVDPSGTSISKSLQLLQTRHCCYCFPPNSHDIRFHVWRFRCVG